MQDRKKAALFALAITQLCSIGTTLSSLHISAFISIGLDAVAMLLMGYLIRSVRRRE